MDVTEMDARCGTDAGYQAHRKAGTVPCDACLAGRRDYINRWRARNSTKCARGLGWPLRSAS